MAQAQAAQALEDALNDHLNDAVQSADPVTALGHLPL